MNSILGAVGKVIYPLSSAVTATEENKKELRVLLVKNLAIKIGFGTLAFAAFTGFALTLPLGLVAIVLPPALPFLGLTAALGAAGFFCLGLTLDKAHENQHLIEDFTCEYL